MKMIDDNDYNCML